MDIKTPSDFGFAVRDAREKAGISQQDLATRLGTTQARISRLERGNGAANLRIVLQISAMLKLTIALIPLENHAEATESTSGEDRDEEIDLDAIVNAGLGPPRRISKR